MNLHHKENLFFPYGVFFILCIAFVYTQVHMPINVDGIWLTAAAHRLINGEPYLLSAYETNPPSAIILYMPVALLMNLELSLKQAFTIYGLTLMSSLLVIIYHYLKKTFNDDFTHYVFIFFTAIVFIIQDYFFFERDLIIGLLLLPFLLNESHSYNKKIQNSEYVFPVILMTEVVLLGWTGKWQS